MMRLIDHRPFRETYRRLARVGLNPLRHTAPHALAHSEEVAARALALARANGLDDEAAGRLEDLGRAHDIGKVTGTARPEKSLEVLRDCGVDDPALLALVKWHDTNLPWWRASQRGQPPSDRAWRRLAAEVELRLLALFMVADRVDAPGGWRRNLPLQWFLGEARARGLLGELVLDLPGVPGEVSAGAALVHAGAVLFIRTRAEGFELPKGGIEWDERPEDAAARELREEAGVTSALSISAELPHLDYDVAGRCKRARYFPMTTTEPIALGPLPARTRERRWVDAAALATLPLVNEGLRPLAFTALWQGSLRDALAAALDDA